MLEIFTQFWNFAVGSEPPLFIMPENSQFYRAYLILIATSNVSVSFETIPGPT